MTKASQHVWLRPTTRAERTFQDAQEHARQAGCRLAQSGHLLLALVQEPRSLSARLLARLNVSAVDVRAEVGRIQAATGGRDDAPRPGAEPSEEAWADNRSQILTSARQEAESLGDKYIGTEHLLLSLLRGTGTAAQALRSQGVTWEKVRAALPEMKAEGLI